MSRESLVQKVLQLVLLSHAFEVWPGSSIAKYDLIG